MILEPQGKDADGNPKPHRWLHVSYTMRHSNRHQIL